jgi:capsular polysaccharide biosynthesis protein
VGKKPQRVLGNEHEVEAAFERVGFTVVRVGRGLSFAHEVSLLQAAHVVAGFQGTNLHNAVFMRTRTPPLSQR